MNLNYVESLYCNPRTLVPQDADKAKEAAEAEALQNPDEVDTLPLFELDPPEANNGAPAVEDCQDSQEPEPVATEEHFEDSQAPELAATEEHFEDSQAPELAATE